MRLKGAPHTWGPPIMGVWGERPAAASLDCSVTHSRSVDFLEVKYPPQAKGQQSSAH